MPLESHRLAFGDRLRDLRRERGWKSQEEFAHHVGMDRTYISGMERGRRNPTLDIIVRLARALEISPAALLDWADVDEPKDARSQSKSKKS